jgi:hypothetical protein
MPENSVQDLLSHPAVQGGVAPLIAGFVAALALARTRFAGLAILAGYATVIALSTGFSFSPLSASRKILLVGLATPLMGLVADFLPRAGRVFLPAFALAAALAAVWVFLPVLQNKDAATAWPIAAGLALLAFALVWLVGARRDDGVRTAAAGVGLGVALGIAAVLSASTGYLLQGLGIAAASGGLLLVQMILNRGARTGFTAALPIGALIALFGGAIFVLAAAPWYALPLLVMVPLAAAVPVPAGWGTWLRAFAIGACAVAAALPTILAAWHAARGSAG